jgi:hypothetical protein
MEWLEASLAFAVTIMVFSTMVSVIVESFHRIFRLREDGLRRIVEELFDQTIWPKFSVKLMATVDLADRANSKDQLRKQFAKIMTKSRFNPKIKPKALMPRVTNAGQLMALTSLEMLERLAETDIGTQILKVGHQKGRQILTILIKDCISKFEDIGENASDYFARRARFLSVAISIGLAFVIHLDATELFKYYLSNRLARMAMIAQGEVIAEQLEAQEKNLKALTDGEVVDQKENINELSGNIKELKSTFDTMISSGVPIGWSERPWKKNAQAWNKLETRWKIVRGLWWFFSVLLAGLLIGLGGPFWFETFRKLSSLTGVVKGLVSDVQKEKDRPKSGADKQPEDSRVDPVEVFKNAAAAKVFEFPSEGRALLNADGSIVERR